MLSIFHHVVGNLSASMARDDQRREIEPLPLGFGQILLTGMLRQVSVTGQQPQIFPVGGADE